MFNVGPFELPAIFVVAPVVLDPDNLPEVEKQAGRAMREFRKFETFIHERARDVVEPIVGPNIPNGSIGRDSHRWYPAAHGPGVRTGRRRAVATARIRSAQPERMVERARCG
jgi:hypothetical protein